MKDIKNIPDRNASAFSSPLSGRFHGNAGFSMLHFNLDRLDDGRSPLLLLDDFRVAARPFGPHPHAGFSAITYVFEDSPGALNSRDSLGNELTIGPGGLVWLQSGRGALHEETPQDSGREIHGAQIYVNLRAANKSLAPQTLWLNGKDVPAWSDENGNLVRVMVGSYRNMVSPLVPAEPFTMLDLRVRSEISVELERDNYTLIYARDRASLTIGPETVTLAFGQIVTVEHSQTLTISAREPARLLFLSGARIDEPRHQEGPFVMNRHEEMAIILKRYNRGEMGYLLPRP